MEAETGAAPASFLPGSLEDFQAGGSLQFPRQQIPNLEEPGERQTLYRFPSEHFGTAGQKPAGLFGRIFGDLSWAGKSYNGGLSSIIGKILTRRFMSNINKKRWTKGFREKRLKPC